MNQELCNVLLERLTDDLREVDFEEAIRLPPSSADVQFDVRLASLFVAASTLRQEQIENDPTWDFYQRLFFLLVCERLVDDNFKFPVDVSLNRIIDNDYSLLDVIGRIKVNYRIGLPPTGELSRAVRFDPESMKFLTFYPLSMKEKKDILDGIYKSSGVTRNVGRFDMSEDELQRRHAKFLTDELALLGYNYYLFFE